MKKPVLQDEAFLADVGQTRLQQAIGLLQNEELWVLPPAD